MFAGGDDPEVLIPMLYWAREKCPISFSGHTQGSNIACERYGQRTDNHILRTDEDKDTWFVVGADG